MALEPFWGVLIGLGIAPLIKIHLDGRKASKLSAGGQCPACKSPLVDKPFTTVTLGVCPQKHGFRSGDGQWVKAKVIEKATRDYRSQRLEDLPQAAIIFWAMYHVLYSDGPVDTTPVDNVPKARKRR